MRVMSNGRVRRTEAEWRALITKQERSGLSAAAFCREERLHSSNFLKWQRRLSPSPSQADFVTLVAPSSRSDTAAGWSVEVTLPNGATLRLRS